MQPVRWGASVLLTVVTSASACDSGSSKADGDAKTAVAEAKPASATAPTDNPARNGKDKGDATVTMDGKPWAAERCTARIKAADGGEKLTVSCSHTASGDGAVNREEIALVVADYKGPGTYTAAGNSRYASVGVDTAAANAAEEDEAKNEVVTDSIRGARHVMLNGAQVVVSAASAAAIDGTFEWAPQPGKEGPTLADGKFHAVRKD